MSSCPDSGAHHWIIRNQLRSPFTSIIIEYANYGWYVSYKTGKDQDLQANKVVARELPEG